MDIDPRSEGAADSAPAPEAPDESLPSIVPPTKYDLKRVPFNLLGPQNGTTIAALCLLIISQGKRKRKRFEVISDDVRHELMGI